jgi:hypothetical protein
MNAKFNPGLLILGMASVLCAAALGCSSESDRAEPDWTDWNRPVDNPVFTVGHGNNHDAILCIEPDLEYPYHLIISHTAEGAHLWRARKFSWDSSGWKPRRAMGK